MSNSEALPLARLDLGPLSGHYKSMSEGRGSAVYAVPGSDGFSKSSAVSLLFAPGERPSSSAIRALAESTADYAISLDPFAGVPHLAVVPPGRGTARQGGRGRQRARDARWLEILANGLTFDLAGLAPGPGEYLPDRAHAYGLTAEELAAPLEAVRLAPGPHLTGGSTMLPVIRCLAWLAARLSALPGTRAVSWHAARCWSGPVHFRDGVLRWMEGGAFPGLGLTALAPVPDGGMQSEGLALFTGQELRIEPELALDRAESAKLALRLIHLLVDNGPVTAAEQVTLPGAVRLRLEPSANRRFVRVWRD